MKDVVYEAAVAPIEGYLRQLGTPDTSQLHRRVELDFLRENSAEEQAFVVGDLWPGGVLLGNSDGPNKVIGVIDFEFSSLGRGLNGDMAQLFAHLHLHLLGSLEGSPAHVALIASIGSTYSREYFRITLGTTCLRSWKVTIICAVCIFYKRPSATVSISQAWTGND